MKSPSNIESKRCRPLLGTFVEISVRDADEDRRNRAFDSAFAEIEKAQRLMSFHDPSSELSQLNRQAFRKPVRVHEWTWQVLVSSKEFGSKSEGAFDITIAPHLSRWRYLPNQYATDAGATFRDILLGSTRTVRFARPLSIDLGGIAKGFAVDRAVESLRTAGIKSGTVNAGGDLRVFGPDPQQIHLRDPMMPGLSTGTVQLRDRAIATSGVYFSQKLWRGLEVSPLIDTKRDRPFTGDMSVAVSAPDCLTADALTKVVLAQREDSLALLREFEADAIILERGKIPQLLSVHATKLD